MEWRDLPIDHCPRGGEVETLQFALDRVRRQFAWKTGGLTAEQLRRRHAPSSMTLAGLVKHMAFVEDGFTARAADRPSRRLGTRGVGSRMIGGHGSPRSRTSRRIFTHSGTALLRARAPPGNSSARTAGSMW
jgi:hypothetical protein